VQKSSPSTSPCAEIRARCKAAPCPPPQRSLARTPTAPTAPDDAEGPPEADPPAPTEEEAAAPTEGDVEEAAAVAGADPTEADGRGPVDPLPDDIPHGPIHNIFYSHGQYILFN